VVHALPISIVANCISEPLDCQVSNHRSMLDDPAMMSSILPLWMSVQPKYIRWSVCAQDFCFNPAYSSLISTLSGAYYLTIILIDDEEYLHDLSLGKGIRYDLLIK
jgi:hypothetical protein